MSRRKIAIMIDDNASFVMAIIDELKFFLWENEITLLPCLSLKRLSNIVKKEGASDLVVAVIDLWMIDKDSNTQNTKAGIEAIKKIREKWVDCYIIVLSAHINNEVSEELGEFSGISVVKKPIPTSTIIDLMQKVINS